MTKFLNTAHPTDPLPSLVNVDHLARVRPGSCDNNRSGRDQQCCLVFTMVQDVEYEDNSVKREVYTVDVHLPITEVVRRLTKELLTI